ncbi:MAG: FxLYD domain-containing protein [Firmicutes bacterium]|nr:FxLYD domain-containing protein [Bacillota bacterium]
MDRLKTFKWYFIIFALFFSATWLLTSGVAMKKSNEVVYKTDFASPAVNITSSTANGGKVHLTGKVTNNTDSAIGLKYLKFDFFDENGAYLGTKSQELKNFHPGETNNIDVSTMFSHTNVGDVKVSLADSKPEDVTNSVFGNMFGDINNSQYKDLYTIFGGLLFLCLILPPW